MLAIARRRTGGDDRLTFVRGDGGRLPFADGSFDVVTCTLALHHFEPEPARALLREMRRVARMTPIVGDLRRSAPAYAATWVYARVTSRNRLTRHDAPLSVRRAYTPREAVALAREAGWRAPGVRREPFFRMTLARWLTSSSPGADRPEPPCALALARAGLARDVGRARGVSAAQGLRRVPQRRAPWRRWTGSGLAAAVREHATALRGVRLVPPRAPAVELPFGHGALACERATLDAIRARRGGRGRRHARARPRRGRAARGRPRAPGVRLRRDDGGSDDVPRALDRRRGRLRLGRRAARGARAPQPGRVALRRRRPLHEGSATSTASSRCTSARARTSRSTRSAAASPT